MISDRPIKQIIGQKLEDLALGLEGSRFEEFPNRAEKLGYAGIGYGLAIESYALSVAAGAVAMTSSVVDDRIKLEKNSEYDFFEQDWEDIGENIGGAFYDQGKGNVIDLDEDEYEFRD